MLAILIIGGRTLQEKSYVSTCVAKNGKKPGWKCQKINVETRCKSFLKINLLCMPLSRFFPYIESLLTLAFDIAMPKSVYMLSGILSQQVK